MTGWSNWSGSVAASPRRIAKPRDAAELAALVSQAHKVRVVGAGHSFMPLCETDDLLLNLSDYEGAIEVAVDRKTAWAPAGWSLKRLTAALWEKGLSLINQGDIDPQSLAGAISTGTHGTGAELGSLSTQACGFRLMTADGAIVECGPDQNLELFQAQRLSLGLLGVAVQIRIYVVPAYHLEERVERRPLAEVAERLDELAAATRHMEFFVFPYSDEVIFKTLQLVEAEAPARPAKEIGEDSEATFKAICDLCAAVPILTPSLQRLMMRMMGKASRRVGPAYTIFPSERNVRFEEMEYELPRAAGLPTLKAAMAHIRKRRLPITFPFEFRLAAGDDIWMSPFNAGPGASISFHQYARMPWRPAFAEMEAVLRDGAGRPHWAKRHTLTAADVHRLYPRAGDFVAACKAWDPAGKFANAHLTQLFGL
ncbi:D-arabinono-1,4-lactone oxidase [Caulobacter sp. UNC279MFTsu5.1]|uniref:D-arabinono-1,4-lactone oxidase n=1 Tax=Caulobacter sp. UNC279MFTsu5.1 TaxID=1502775 RepID=UPI0008F1DF45|nr:D-arabinono-1,4-lactone oxidase [Caulobacter sp. UNC279MFTsu5.1]SFJ95711.1 FAD-linked oxidoreductase [Caulobacter sp. UNC279MFTsu5.1]